MITNRIKIIIAHEISTNKEYSVAELDTKVRELLHNNTSDARFWELGKDFCYEDSYPVEMSITTSFDV